MIAAPLAPPDRPAAGWRRVMWTEAGQVAGLVDDLPLDEAERTLAPEAWVARHAADAPDQAVRFLGLALPRLEATAWAKATLEACGVRGAAEQAVLVAAAHWLECPDDERRRACWDAAEALAEGPARFLGAAVLFSGGSLSMPDLAPVAPPPAACGVAAGATVLGAALRSADPAAALADALARGARIAAGEG